MACLLLPSGWWGLGGGAREGLACGWVYMAVEVSGQRCGWSSGLKVSMGRGEMQNAAQAVEDEGTGVQVG